MWLIELVERTIHIIGSVCVVGILYVEIDDIYGVTNVKRNSKRRWRKMLRKWAKKKRK